MKTVVMNAEDSGNGLETGTCSLSIPDNVILNQTENLSTVLRICIRATVMLSYNIDATKPLISLISLVSLVFLPSVEANGRMF